MADGFLGRWARRKEAVRQGKEVPPEPVQAAEAPVSPPQAAPVGAKGGELAAADAAQVRPAEPPAAPTLEDAESLTRESDFTRFVRPGVDPQVKNTALKKLFTDPHFNVMDGLDVYIDDYGKPDPMPPGMLEQLASHQFLQRAHADEKARDEAREKVREEAQEEARQRAARDEPEEIPTESETPGDDVPDSVAQSSTRTAQALPPAEDHADPDLRLQQDDAPGREVPGARSR